MASSRKKLDEKNLKTLREIGALPQNKYCFDCNQRGPTYVDMTIGSFVCTKCSGMLRGLTPPHRIKSISMATFSPEEIELLRNRGNDYCKNVWLGLYEGILPPAGNTDEQAIRDFMVDKYERKRYYLDPSQALRNGHVKAKPLSALVSEPKPIKLLNGNATEINRKRPEVANKNNTAFAVNFDNADIFASSNGNRNGAVLQESFANFDDNPVFSTASNNQTDQFSIFDLKYTHSGPHLNQVPLFPKCNTNRWSLPTPPTYINHNLTQKAPAAPLEDKYAALKDLDNALKTNNAVDWNSSGSNSSLYSSPTPTGSVYSSPSPQSSMFGSPSQGFLNGFPNSQDSNFSNPFSTNGGAWSNGNAQPFANPFREPPRVNGFAAFQPAVFPASPWGAPNPFQVGTTAHGNTNNPFL